jgi:hypothetical protein
VTLTANEAEVFVLLPKGFDKLRHMDRLAALIAKDKPGWKLRDIRDGRAYLDPIVTTHQFISSGIDGVPDKVELKSDFRLSNGPEFSNFVAVTKPGFEVITFVPAAGYATICKMDVDVARCREEAAKVVGCQKWEIGIQVTRNQLGEALQFELDLPKYTPNSPHDDGLLRVAHFTVGHEGWSVRTDRWTKKCVMSSGPRWSFSSKAIPLPRPSSKTANATSLAFGERINQGDVEEAIASINFVDHPHALITGETRSGKGELVKSLIANAIAGGWGFVVAESVKKGIDFVDFKPFVLPGMWGCASHAHAQAVISKLDDIYEERIKLCQKYGVQKITQLPADVQPKRILAVVDEFATLTKQDALPKINMKMLPVEMQTARMIQEMQNAIVNGAKGGIVFGISGLLAKAASAGIHMIILTQRASAKSLGDGDARTNFSTRVLLGGTADEGTIKMTITSDGKRGLPEWPLQMLREEEAHELQFRGVENAPPGWRKGAGYVAASGVEPYILKGWWFNTKRLATDSPWKELKAEYARKGYGTEISRADVSRIASIPENLVVALERGRFEAADFAGIEAFEVEDEDDDGVFKPKPKKRAKTAKQDQDDIEAPDRVVHDVATSGSSCAICKQKIHPATMECACEIMPAA